MPNNIEPDADSTERQSDSSDIDLTDEFDDYDDSDTDVIVESQ